eukprot:PhM_4_TR9836/c4_g1_i4/m.18029/K07359/CAMKK2; calcium/calmodulin-dependent protein kinase kinase 2
MGCCATSLKVETNKKRSAGATFARNPTTLASFVVVAHEDGGGDEDDKLVGVVDHSTAVVGPTPSSSAASPLRPSRGRSRNRTDAVFPEATTASETTMMTVTTVTATATTSTITSESQQQQHAEPLINQRRLSSIDTAIDTSPEFENSYRPFVSMATFAATLTNSNGENMPASPLTPTGQSALIRNPSTTSATATGSPTTVITAASRGIKSTGSILKRKGTNNNNNNNSESGGSGTSLAASCTNTLKSSSGTSSLANSYKSADGIGGPLGGSGTTETEDPSECSAAGSVTTAANRVKFAHMSDDDSTALDRSCGALLSSISNILQKTQSAMSYDIINQYRILRSCRRGRFGECRVVVGESSSAQTAYIMRVLVGRSQYIAKVSTLRSLHHPNLVKIVEVIDHEPGDVMYVIEELVQNGPVCYVPFGGADATPDASVPTNIHINHTKTIFRDILFALQFLHRRGIVHGNIRPENILCSKDNQAKLSDAGINLEGQSAFPPPEGMGSHTKAADVWALGMSLYLVLCGRMPQFKASSNEHVLNVAPLGAACPLELTDALRRMLRRNEAERITVDMLLGHPLFAQTSKVSLQLYVNVWKERKRAVEVKRKQMVLRGVAMK